VNVGRNSATAAAETPFSGFFKIAFVAPHRAKWKVTPRPPLGIGCWRCWEQPKCSSSLAGATKPRSRQPRPLQTLKTQSLTRRRQPHRPCLRIWRLENVASVSTSGEEIRQKASLTTMAATTTAATDTNQHTLDAGAAAMAMRVTATAASP
jgi:hypothetical protein